MSHIVRTAVLVLVCLVATHSLAPASPGACPILPDKRTKEILAIVKDQKNQTPAAVLDELGAMRTSAAFGVLKRCADEMSQQYAKQRVFSAMRFMASDPDLGGKVLDYVEKIAGSRDAVEARAATNAMASFGEAAHERLRTVAERGADPKARASALRPIRSSLMQAPDEDALELVLGNFSVPESGSLEQGYQLLRAFRTRGQLEELDDYVGDKRSRMAMRKLIVVAMGGHGDDLAGDLAGAVDGVLLTALRGRDPVLEYHALTSMARRGGLSSKDGLRPVQRLADSDEPTVRRAAMLVLVVQNAAGFDPVELARDKDSIARQAAAIGLAREADDGSLAALHGLFADEDQVVRAEAIRAATRRRDKRSIQALIARMDVEEGRLQADVRTALQSLTARDYGLREGAWAAFWAKEGEDFQLPSPEVARAAAEERAGRKSVGESSAAFYGIDIVSNRFALLIDTSGSMGAKSYTGSTRIDVAREQLQKTLKRLRDGVLFNVIPFSGSADPMEDGLVAMDEEQRENALIFATALRPNGGTNIYDALAAAFDDERVDTIFLMSDGAPSAGEITDVRELQEEVERWNSVRGVVIHCIAVGQDHPLLRGLADATGGKYTRVD